MFERILVPLDGSLLAECVLPLVKVIARCFGSEIHLLCVQIPVSGDTQPVDPFQWNLQVAEDKCYLDNIKEKLEQSGLNVTAQVLEGRAADNIIQFAESKDISLIILSSHGRSGITGWNISSVVQKVIFRARTSVLLIRAYEYFPVDSEITLRNILLPIDSSQRAEYALPYAVTLAETQQSKLHLAYVVKRTEIIGHLPADIKDQELANQLTEVNKKRAEAYLRDLLSRLNISPETHLEVSDNVLETLHNLVEKADIDLVVLTAHGHTGGFKRPYGSITLSFLLFGTTPVLVAQDVPRQFHIKTKAELAAEEKGGRSSG
jgi:nucleotide-binding universal stress UspA family protein